jgi:hypothetical protein
MHLSRLLLFSLMASALSLPAVAQSSPSDQPGASAPLFSAPKPKADSRSRVPAFSAKPRVTYEFGDGLGDAQGVGSAISPTQPRPFKLNMRKLTPPLLNRKTIEIASAAGPNGILARGCYTVRTYRFERDAPGSDATSLKESYSCASAAQFQAKYIVGPLTNQAIQQLQPIVPVR